MKIALITDTHYGVRGDNIAFMDNSKLFLDNVFFPYLDKNSINTVIHLGDIVDRRKYINFYTLHRLRQDFLQPILEREIDFHMIAGNHDTFFKNTNEINAIRELKIPGFCYESNAEEVIFDGLKILFIPWVCDDNRVKTLEKIESSTAQIIMGHLEIAGFEMHKGSIVSHGQDRNVFDKFDMVMTGHFHHRSSDGHIFYLGSHAEFTWADYDDPKGFHIFDTDTRELTFIVNPYNMFKKIVYNDIDKEYSDFDVDLSEYKNTIVKVVVVEKTNNLLFEKFIEKLEKEEPLEVIVVEINSDIILSDDVINEAESTLDMFRQYVNMIELKSEEKSKVENKIIDLYNKAISLE
jgi:DNA repair exonuclease SbcCD nuclease subunit